MLNGFYTICPARRNGDCIHNTLYHQGRRATLKDAVEDISYSAATMVKRWRVVGRLLIWQVALLWMLFRALRAALALVRWDYSTRSLTCFVNCGKALGVLWLWSDHRQKRAKLSFYSMANSPSPSFSLKMLVAGNSMMVNATGRMLESDGIADDKICWWLRWCQWPTLIWFCFTPIVTWMACDVWTVWLEAWLVL